MTKFGRNDPCPCGSGKKYKNCCARSGAGDSSPQAVSSASLWGGDIFGTKRRALQSYDEGRFANALLMCQEVLRVTPNDPDVGYVIRLILHATKNAIQNFHRNLNSTSIDALRHIRRELIYVLFEFPEDALSTLWFPFLEEAHMAIKESGLRELQRDAEDESIFRALYQQLNVQERGGCYPFRLLAGMVLCQNFELPAPADLAAIPDWLRERYCAFLLEMPQVYSSLGEAEVYVEYLASVVNLFHEQSLGEHGVEHNPLARQFAQLFVAKANFLQAYFSTTNLRSIYAKRGDLISAALVGDGALTLNSCQPRAEREGKIKLGILVQHLGSTTETYFTISHFEQIDRSQFEVTLYVLSATGQRLEQLCVKLADRFVVLPGNDIQAQANRIRADDLDILLFGTNMTAVTNAVALLGAHRLARIQVASVSSPVTTGLRHMDVMLSAHWNEPTGDAPEHYTEHLVRMPGSINYYAYQYDTDSPTISFSRKNIGISEKAVVFFSGANYFKIIPELSLLWVRILTAVPDSVLLLMPFNRNWSSDYSVLPFVARLHDQMRMSGISPERLRIINPVPTRADVHRIVEIADVYLDAYPFAGACSMLDPIMSCVPPIVRSGSVGRSNHGASLMRMLELDELICDSENDYIAAAVEMGSNPAKRERVRATLNALKREQPPPYFDTTGFSGRVGGALVKLYDRYLSRYQTLKQATPARLRHELQELANAVVVRNIELDTLTDLGIVKSLIEPFFRAHQGERVHHMIDVGACYGAMSEPFLARGWSADVFEPDPSCRAVLERNVLPYGARCRIIPSAVSSISDREIDFHKSVTNGLSGLADSPFGSTDMVIRVPCVRLADFYKEQNVPFVDFLKIDAEGYDFEVLASHDFNSLRPRLVLVEYGTHFPRQSLDCINQTITTMAAMGYGAISFSYDDDGNFKQGIWNYRLIKIIVDQLLPDLGRVMFGNILFYQVEDREFLLALHALLDVCKPRKTVWEGN